MGTPGPDTAVVTIHVGGNTANTPPKFVNSSPPRFDIFLAPAQATGSYPIGSIEIEIPYTESDGDAVTSRIPLHFQDANNLWEQNPDFIRDNFTSEVTERNGVKIVVIKNTRSVSLRTMRNLQTFVIEISDKDGSDTATITMQTVTPNGVPMYSIPSYFLAIPSTVANNDVLLTVSASDPEGDEFNYTMDSNLAPFLAMDKQPNKSAQIRVIDASGLLDFIRNSANTGNSPDGGGVASAFYGRMVVTDTTNASDGAELIVCEAGSEDMIDQVDKYLVDWERLSRIRANASHANAVAMVNTHAIELFQKIQNHLNSFGAGANLGWAFTGLIPSAPGSAVPLQATSSAVILVVGNIAATIAAGQANTVVSQLQTAFVAEADLRLAGELQGLEVRYQSQSNDWAARKSAIPRMSTESEKTNAVLEYFTKLQSAMPLPSSIPPTADELWQGLSEILSRNF